MDKFNSSQKVGDIVISFPKAADVLKAVPETYDDASLASCVL
jgi:iron-sulfur cluster repair protein YtfE (RIC family)